MVIDARIQGVNASGSGVSNDVVINHEDGDDDGYSSVQ